MSSTKKSKNQKDYRFGLWENVDDIYFIHANDVPKTEALGMLQVYKVFSLIFGIRQEAAELIKRGERFYFEECSGISGGKISFPEARKSFYAQHCLATTLDLKEIQYIAEGQAFSREEYEEAQNAQGFRPCRRDPPRLLPPGR